uniref:Uncharacterized protein n=1 Tax=Picea glauca TaxID=3330 RepID=A0A117NFQ8_PICGL|nr:hypothetical protein ABT39_MTgene2471 [Picea glauca]QHR88547.1 hypothetical protein Q903MT_gene2561 [Picea sitchensis]
MNQSALLSIDGDRYLFYFLPIDRYENGGSYSWQMLSPSGRSPEGRCWLSLIPRPIYISRVHKLPIYRSTLNRFPYRCRLSPLRPVPISSCMPVEPSVLGSSSPFSTLLLSGRVRLSGFVCLVQAGNGENQLAYRGFFRSCQIAGFS